MKEHVDIVTRIYGHLNKMIDILEQKDKAILEAKCETVARYDDILLLTEKLTFSERECDQLRQHLATIRTRTPIDRPISQT